MSLRYALRSCCTRITLLRYLGTLILLGFIVATCTLGAYLNRLRGGLWPHRNETDSNINYWFDHMVPRMMVGVGGGALSALFLDWRVTMAVCIQLWFGCYSGWGCWFHLETVNPCGRVSEFDWLLGRQDVQGGPGTDWPLARRTVLDYAGLAWRGLQWTAPAGYFMWQRGLGSLFFLGGSLMAPVYYITQMGPIGGTETSEWTWGAFLWAFILISYLRNVILYGSPSKFLLESVEYKRLPIRQSALDHTFGRLYENCIRQFVRVKKHYKRFNLSLAYICCFVFTTSTMFYGVIIQKDNRNKAQTLFGILTSALFMILVVTHYESKDYYLRKIEQKLMPRAIRANSNNSTSSNESVATQKSSVSIRTRNLVESGTSMGEEQYRHDNDSLTESTNQMETAQSVISSQIIEGRDLHSFHVFLWQWTFPGCILLMESTLRILSILNIIMVYGFTLYSFIANIHTDRMVNAGCIAPPPKI